MKQCGHELMVIHGFLVPECSRDAERQSEQNKLCSGGGREPGFAAAVLLEAFASLRGELPGALFKAGAMAGLSFTLPPRKEESPPGQRRLSLLPTFELMKNFDKFAL